MRLFNTCAIVCLMYFNRRSSVLVNESHLFSSLDRAPSVYYIYYYIHYGGFFLFLKIIFVQDDRINRIAERISRTQ